MSIPDPGVCTVYRLYDTAGDLLYVGASQNLPGRLQAHKKDRRWRDLLDSSRTAHEVCATEKEMWARENELLAAEPGRFNVSGVAGRFRPMPPGCGPRVLETVATLYGMSVDQWKREHGDQIRPARLAIARYITAHPEEADRLDEYGLFPTVTASDKLGALLRSIVAIPIDDVDGAVSVLRRHYSLQEILAACATSIGEPHGADL